ncbi:hypothetical protein AB290_05725 [Listeria monocytogenes]|uniref:T7SS effector LXG polymorphic toxin n=1 Tax=Listeria monocytogenes TaxID=1639 RepID=UPI0010E97DBB|nr:T7SS effector LXG polymorphic toxin [Listeria monocytogenes]EAD7631413.1 hypothetical protein [Listeria monocytogenes]
MKIDVRELNEIVSENIVMLKKEYENLNIAMNATTNFTVETQEFFKGKTADASRAYLQEAYKPVQQKTLEVNKLMTKILSEYIADAEAQFGANGMIDIQSIEMEYKRSFNQVSDDEMREYRDLNNLIQEANEFTYFQSSNLGFFEELHHDALTEITNIRMKLEDFETKWNVELSKVEKLQKELEWMLTQVNDNKIIPTSYQAGTLPFGKPFKSRDEFDTVQEYYQYVVEWAVANGKAKEIIVDGQIYYEFTDTFYYQNYKQEVNGTLVMTEVNGEMILFIQRKDTENAVAVPFGVFYPDPFQRLANEGESGDIIKLYHWKSKDIPEGLNIPNDELKTMADFFASTQNSYDASMAILKYLAHNENPEKLTFTDTELNEVATNWSGGKNRFDFAGEVEAHADMLTDSILTEFAGKRMYKKDGDGTEEQKDMEYYQAASIADMKKGENGKMNEYFNLIWGSGQYSAYLQNLMHGQENTPKAKKRSLHANNFL